MKTIRYFCVAMLMTVILGGSALAQSVTVDYDHNANFERYHTYYWLKVKTSNPLWEQRIQDAVDKELKKPEKNEKALEKAVEKMFKNFPPKK